MSAFAKTRAAAEYAARHARTELARTRAAVLLARLGACQAATVGGDGQPPQIAGLLRDLVLAVRDLAGPGWLQARSDDPQLTRGWRGAALRALPRRWARGNASMPPPARRDRGPGARVGAGAGAGPRSRRWAGTGTTGCGIHA